MQLSFLELKLAKEAKRKAEKLMSRYKMLQAIIESKKMDLEPKMVASYSGNESQRGNQFYSEPEKLTMTELEIEEYRRTIVKLNLVYNSMKPIQQEIWDNRYLLDRSDNEVYTYLNIQAKVYYVLKKEMITVVALAFGFDTE